MMPSASAYFQALAQILSRLEVTDGYGAVLASDEGPRKAEAMVLAVRATSAKVMLVGNGGSAAIASHMQNDLSKGGAVRAIVFNEPPLLTALSNDDGYVRVFEKPVELWANPGDLLIAISSSGQSENILRAVRTSVGRGCQVITFSGFRPDNPLRFLGHLNFYAPSQVYGHVELAHSALGHFLTDCAMLSRSLAARSHE